MSSLTNYGEQQILDHLFNLATFAQPTIYIGVSTADPTEGGTGLNEPSGNGYARIQTAASDWTRNVSTVENANELTFPEATGSWGTVTHAVLTDASTGGNVIAFAPLATPRGIVQNDTLRFPAGDITFSLD